jgi:hypothetical protein
MDTNMKRYWEALETVPKESRLNFETYFLGYISSSVTEDKWMKALEESKRYLEMIAKLAQTQQQQKVS